MMTKLGRVTFVTGLLGRARTLFHGFGPKGEYPSRSCERCIYWKSDGVLRGYGAHECLNRAPTEGRYVGGYIHPRWPMTEALMWCGEFEPR